MQKLLKTFSPAFYKYLITAILIVVPLFPKFPSIRIPGIYVAIRLEDFLIFGTLILFLIPILANVKTLIRNNIVRSIILFTAIGLVSLISGIYLTQTVTKTIGILHWFRRIEYMSLFFVGYIYIKKINKGHFFGYLLKVLLLINLIIFIYGIGQHYFNFPVIVTQNEEYSKGIALRWVPGAHINSTFAGHYDLASYVVLTLPFFVTAFFVFKNKLSKVLILLSIAMGFWLLSVAVSRISIVAFLVAVTVSLFTVKKYKEIAAVAIISIIIFGFSPDLRVRYGRIIEVLRQKISSVIIVHAQDNGNVNEDRSSSIRFVVEWPRAIRAFYKNPILGTGYSSITLATDNDYLRALGETGALGLSCLLLIIFNLVKNFMAYKFNFKRESIFVSGMFGSFIGILITALFIDIFESSKFALMFWLMMGLFIGIKKDEQLN